VGKKTGGGKKKTQTLQDSRKKKTGAVRHRSVKKLQRNGEGVKGGEGGGTNLTNKDFLVDRRRDFPTLGLPKHPEKYKGTGAGSGGI